MKPESFKVEVYKRALRDYYNETMGILEDLDDEEITLPQAEKALIQLDEKYAHKLSGI